MGEGLLYTLNGKVQAAEGHVYLVRAADAELARLCRAHSFAYVLHTRQVGKSSLLTNVADELEAGGARVVVVDLLMFGSDVVTADQWYFGLVAEIAEQTRLQIDVLAWWAARAHFGFTQRLRKFFIEVLLPAAESEVFVFLDEIDTTVPLTFTDDVFAAIRELYQARDREPALRRLTFVLAGSTSPNDLIRDPARTPFNIGVSVELSDFTLDEAMPLADGLSADRAEAKRLLGWIFGWTSGHPYLTQNACYAVAEAAPRAWTEDDVDAIIADRFLHPEGDQDKNVAYVTDMLTERADRFGREDVLRAYKRILLGRRVADDRQSLVLSHLKLAGVVVAREGGLAIRNRLYARVFDRAWVDQHLPVNWQRVARAALWALPVVSVPLAVVSLVLWQRAAHAYGAREEALTEAKAALAGARLSAQHAEEAAAAARQAAEQEAAARRETEAALAQAREAERAARQAGDEANKARSDLKSRNDELSRATWALQDKNTELVRKAEGVAQELARCAPLESRATKLETDLAACRGTRPAPQ